MDVRNPNSDNREETVIEACARNGNTAPCWQIVPNVMECPTAPNNLSIEVNRGGGAPPSGTFLEVQCVTE